MILTLVAAGSAAVLWLSGSAKLAELDAVLLATFGASLVVAWCKPIFSLARGGVTVAAVLVPALWLVGYFYGDMPGKSALLLALAPTAAWLGQVGPLRRLRPWQATCLRAAAVLIPVAAAVKIAWDAAPPPDVSLSQPFSTGFFLRAF